MNKAPGFMLAQLKLCSGCLRLSSEMKICKGCLLLTYCGQECQNRHWTSHRDSCKRVEVARKTKFGDAAHAEMTKSIADVLHDAVERPPSDGATASGRLGTLVREICKPVSAPLVVFYIHYLLDHAISRAMLEHALLWMFESWKHMSEVYKGAKIFVDGNVVGMMVFDPPKKDQFPPRAFDGWEPGAAHFSVSCGSAMATFDVHMPRA